MGIAVLLLVAPALVASAQTIDGAWLRQVANEYATWGRVDDELRWAPWLCRLPMPSQARVSQAEAAHGRKVYFVYASDRAAYVELTRGSRARPDPGFTVVKESFHPRPIEGDELDRVPIPGHPTSEPPSLDMSHGMPSRDVYRPVPDGEGHLTGAGEPAGLYVLRYLGEGAPGTDDGWTYGTLTPRGEVTASGRVEQCMSCHRSAPHGRLFGDDG